MIFLADVFDRIPLSGLGWSVIGFIAICIGYAAFMGAIQGHRNVFGRKPPFDDDLRSQKKILDDLKEKLAGLAPDEKVNELVKQLGNFATAKSVREIEKQLTSFITQKDFDERFRLLEAHMGEGWREIRREIEQTRRTSEEQREGMHNRIGVIAEVLFDIRGRLRAQAGEAP